jgi:hypothetical protein
MRRLTKIFEAFYFSLPIRLLIQQIQHHKVLLLFWLLLLGTISGAIAEGYGGAHLFLEPEYLGRESFWSLLLVGSALGAFLFAYMITFYINESYRFPFVTHHRSPFYVLSFNNFLIPGSFLCFYFYKFICYHSDLAGGLTLDVVEKTLALILGMSLVFAVAASYFFANRSLFHDYGRRLEQELATAGGTHNRKVILDKAKESFRFIQRVDSYLSLTCRLRQVSHDRLPPFREVVKTLNQHHGKLLLLQILTFVLLAILGLLEGNAYFQIPAGASFLLIMALSIMVIGAVNFWFRKMGAFTILAFVGVIALYNQFEVFQEQHQAFGMNYQAAPADYTFDHLQTLVSDSIYAHDRAWTLASLNQWKARYQAKHGRYAKPRAIVVTASGGGLRSAFWTFRVMQEIDSLSQGKVSDEIRFMCGASGGMFGLSYFRELYWRQQQGELASLQATQYQENISKDLLNRVFFKMFTDIVLPTRSVQVGDESYDWETGYSFDQQLAHNLPQLAGRRLGDYREAEAQGLIPQLVLSPTVINQGRQLYVSASPVSYLARPNRITDRYFTRSRGVEFSRLFAQHDPDSLLMTTALRMNATFPIVLPVVELPSHPLMEVMDAGAIDNYGTQTAVKFLFEYRDWLANNTAGVLLIQIRDNDRLDPIREAHLPITRTLASINGGVYSMSQAKDINNDYLLEFMQEWYPGNLEVVTIEHPNERSKEPTSLSLHLTQREKRNLDSRIYAPINEPAFLLLRELYAPELLANKK